MYPCQVLTKKLHTGLWDLCSTARVILRTYNTSTRAFLKISQRNSLLYRFRSIRVEIGNSIDQL